MENFEYILAFFGIVGYICIIVSIVFLTYRNSWVYDYRQMVRIKCRDKINNLPSYMIMLLQVTKWDYTEYLKD